MAEGKKIVLGLGFFSIGDVPVGLTRGGGKFTTENVVREIAADGDKGKVKGRVTIDEIRPKLSMNALELLTDNLGLCFSNVIKNTEGKYTSSFDIPDSVYKDVTWKGKTKDGQAVIITVKNAINLDNIDWSLVEKDEIVSALNFEGCYEEGDTIPPFDIEFVTAVTNSNNAPANNDSNAEGSEGE